CAALELTSVDLVGNDTGGAIAQIFAARRPELLSTFTLTNCDTHDNIPPKAFERTVEAARRGVLAPRLRGLLDDPGRGRESFYGPGYEDIEKLPEEIFRAFVEPLAGTEEAARQFQRWIATINADDLLVA